jgi:hypothetical protein
LREGYRLRIFEYRLLKMMAGPKRDEVRENWGDCMMRNFMVSNQP